MTAQEARKIVLVTAVGSPFCVAIEDGNKVHNLIAEAFDKNERVAISFAGVRRLTTAFLNAAVGQLYNEYTEERIRDALQIIEVSQDDVRLVARVVENAKKFFLSPERNRAIQDDALRNGR